MEQVRSEQKNASNENEEAPAGDSRSNACTCGTNGASNNLPRQVCDVVVECLPTLCQTLAQTVEQLQQCTTVMAELTESYRKRKNREVARSGYIVLEPPVNIGNGESSLSDSGMGESLMEEVATYHVLPTSSSIVYGVNGVNAGGPQLVDDGRTRSMNVNSASGSIRQLVEAALFLDGVESQSEANYGRSSKKLEWTNGTGTDSSRCISLVPVASQSANKLLKTSPSWSTSSLHDTTLKKSEIVENPEALCQSHTLQRKSSHNNKSDSKSNGSSSFSCVICLRTFAYHHSLVLHKRSCERKRNSEVRSRKQEKKQKHAEGSNDSLRNFNCKHCGRSFPTPHQVKSHERVHTGVRPYTCYVCRTKFAHGGNMIKHIKSKHPKEKPYQCQCCGEAFLTHGENKSHRKLCPRADQNSQECGRDSPDTATASENEDENIQDERRRNEKSTLSAGNVSPALIGASFKGSGNVINTFSNTIISTVDRTNAGWSYNNQPHLVDNNSVITVKMECVREMKIQEQNLQAQDEGNLHFLSNQHKEIYIKSEPPDYDDVTENSY